MLPIRQGDGTGLVPTRFAELRKGDGTVLWSAGGGTALIDSYEDGDLSEYSESGGASSATNSIPTTDGTFALDISTDTSNITSLGSTGGLDRYPKQDEPFAFNIYIPDTSADNIKIGWALQGEPFTELYGLNFRTFDDTFKLQITGSSVSNTDLDSTSVTWSNYTGKYLLTTVDWQSDGSISVTLYDGTTTDDTTIATLSAADTSYSSGGIGYQLSGSDSGYNAYVDFWRYTDTSGGGGGSTLPYTKNEPIWTGSDVTWTSTTSVDNPAILRDPATGEPAQYNSNYWMAYSDQGGNAGIGIASSSDLTTWSDEGQALSTSNGATWEADNIGSNTLLDMRSYSQTEGDFWLIYHGQEGSGSSRYKRMGIAYSDDMNAWGRGASNPIFDPNPPGGQGAEDFSVVEGDSSWHVVFEDEGNALSNGVRTGETTDALPNSGWTDQGTMFTSDPDGSGVANPCVVVNTNQSTTRYEVYVEADPAGANYSLAATTDEAGFHSEGWTTEGEAVTDPSIPNSIVYFPSDSENRVYYTNNSTGEIGVATGNSLTTR